MSINLWLDSSCVLCRWAVLLSSVTEGAARTLDAAPVLGVEFGVDVVSLMVEGETHVSDLVTLLEEHLLVESLHLIDGRGDVSRCGASSVFLAIEVIGAVEHLQPVCGANGLRVLVEEL